MTHLALLILAILFLGGLALWILKWILITAGAVGEETNAGCGCLTLVGLIGLVVGLVVMIAS